jgi:thiamine-monophosphate kinase
MAKAGVGEFDLIARIRKRVGPDDSVLLGIGDDAAVLAPTPGLALVATTDSLVVDRHFTTDWDCADIGHLALAVNLSDLAAMGARPRWVLLSLTLPDADQQWLDGFLDGFLALAASHETVLVGGNISSGPLNIGVQLLGEVAPKKFARRRGAQVGDVVAVTGTLGDAAAALSLGSNASPELRQRLYRPLARVEAGRVLAKRVSAMIDISDGLVADLTHLLSTDLGARVELEHLPASNALEAAVPEPHQRWQLQLTGGNDYELLVTLDEQHLEAARASVRPLGLDLARIGRIDATGSLNCRLPDGTQLEMDNGGWDHFKD